MKYYIIAGEASGDLHASNLMKELKVLDAQAEFRAWGGDLMRQQGADLVKHIEELAFMGFTEVVMNIRTIFKNISLCKKDIASWKPDALVLVDYPGFNLRIAEWAYSQGITVHYYISPQVWAWKEGRVKKIKRIVKHMYCILPFEKEFYAKHKYEVQFVGHPLLDAISAYTQPTSPDGPPVIALLPGSRKQEIKRMLPEMLKVINSFPDYQFIVAGAPSQDQTFYQQFLQNSRATLWENRTYDLLSISKAALVTSGTATLETALFRVPEVVCYRGGYISYQIARRLVKVKYISLVNLVMDKMVVTELIQNDMHAARMKEELDAILSEKGREDMLGQLDELRQKLGGSGASKRTAQLVWKSLQL